MKTGFYCVVQLQPDRFRREGVNVGVLVTSDEPRRLRLRFVETAARARAMFPGVPVDDKRFAAATRALERRLSELEPTEEAVRAFLDKESSQLVILPPMRAVVDDLDATLARLFDELVAAPGVAARVTCPACELSFDPAASNTRPVSWPENTVSQLGRAWRTPPGWGQGAGAPPLAQPSAYMCALYGGSAPKRDVESTIEKLVSRLKTVPPSPFHTSARLGHDRPQANVYRSKEWS